MIVQAEPEGKNVEAENSAGLEPAHVSEADPEYVLPVVDKFQLRIGEIANAPAQIRNLKLALEVEEQFGKANVGVEFAGAKLAGDLDLKNNGDGSLDLALALGGSGPDLGELIRFYSGEDRFSGGFDRLEYKITGRGSSVLEAWDRRDVDLEVEGATMTYRADEKDWRFTIAKANASWEFGETGQVMSNGQIGEIPWELQFCSDELDLNGRLHYDAIKGKVADMEFEIDPVRDGDPPSGEPTRFRFAMMTGRLSGGLAHQQHRAPSQQQILPPLGRMPLSRQRYRSSSAMKF